MTIVFLQSAMKSFCRIYREIENLTRIKFLDIMYV